MTEPGNMRAPRRGVRRISQPSRLGPVRDAGITVGPRRRIMRRRRSPLGYVFVIAGVLVLAGIVLAAVVRPPSVPANADVAVVAPAVASSTAEPAPEREATPMLANYRSLYLRLPIDPSKITQVAFHQASGDKSFHMTSLAPDADMTQAAKVKHALLSTATSGSAEASAGASSIWNGTVLRLWRSNRRGKPDTAVDVGTEPGTDVYSPVSGTVLQVRSYKLYNKYADYEIHIRPDGWADVDVVLIHVDDVGVVAGDRVVGGVTRIACVRKMSDRVDLQLGGYTRNGGDHVHMQLNQVDVPGKLEELTGS